MDKIKEVTLSFRKWQWYAAMAVALLLISFLMAATIPDYVRYESSGGFQYTGTFMQFWHVFFSGASGIGCIIFSVMALSEIFDIKLDG